MTNHVRIQQADHRMDETAAAIHALQMAAYAQEAALLRVAHFEPLQRTVEDIRRPSNPAEHFIVAIDGRDIVGAVSVEPGREPKTTHIASLVVLPARQRQGIGSQLVQAVIAAHGSQPITVSTALANLPALALYARLGFISGERRTVGRERIEVVLLRRPGTGAGVEAGTGAGAQGKMTG